MSVYSNEVTIKAPKDTLISLITDPFLLSGVFGHISIIRVYDQKQGKYVELSSLSSTSNRFLVVYVFGTPDTKMNLFEGEMEGPIFEVGSVVYRGWTKDQKFTWEVRFEAKAVKPTETLVRILVNADYIVSGLDRLLGRTPFALAQHIVEDHIIPYVKYYLKAESGIELGGITPTKLLDEQGLFSQILPKIKNVSGDVEYGVAVIKGENVSGKMWIKNGKIAGIEVNHKGQTLQGQDATLELVSLLTPVRVTLYAVNLDEVLMSNLEKYVLTSTTQASTTQGFSSV
ncbi:MAG: hypothetical protein NO117_00445 [Sulfolobales archaeon]|nr:hypothetical protein [Sulfolobales archaeon]